RDVSIHFDRLALPVHERQSSLSLIIVVLEDGDALFRVARGHQCTFRIEAQVVAIILAHLSRGVVAISRSRGLSQSVWSSAVLTVGEGTSGPLRDIALHL